MVIQTAIAFKTETDRNLQQSLLKSLQSMLITQKGLFFYCQPVHEPTRSIVIGGESTETEKLAILLPASAFMSSHRQSRVQYSLGLEEVS